MRQETILPADVRLTSHRVYTLVLIGCLVLLFPQYLAVIIRPFQHFDHIASWLETYVPDQNFLSPASLLGTFRQNFAEGAWLFRPFSALSYHILLILTGENYWIQNLIKIALTLMTAHISALIVYRATTNAYAAAFTLATVVTHPVPANLMLYAPEILFAFPMSAGLFVYMNTLRLAEQRREEEARRAKVALLCITALAAGMKEYGVIFAAGMLILTAHSALSEGATTREAFAALLSRSKVFVLAWTGVAILAVKAFAQLLANAHVFDTPTEGLITRLTYNIGYIFPIQLDARLGPFLALLILALIGLALFVAIDEAKLRECKTLGGLFTALGSRIEFIILVLGIFVLIFVSLPANYPPRSSPRYVLPVSILLATLSGIGAHHLFMRLSNGWPVFVSERMAALGLGWLTTSRVALGLLTCWLMLAAPGVGYERTLLFNQEIAKFNGLLNAAIARSETQSVYYLAPPEIYEEVEQTLRGFFSDRGRRLFGVNTRPFATLPKTDAAGTLPAQFSIVSTRPTNEVLSVLAAYDGLYVTEILASADPQAWRGGMRGATAVMVRLSRALGGYAKPYWESGTLASSRRVFYQLYEVRRASAQPVSEGARVVRSWATALAAPTQPLREVDERRILAEYVFSASSPSMQVAVDQARLTTQVDMLRYAVRSQDGVEIWQGWCAPSKECFAVSETLELSPGGRYAIEFFTYASDAWNMPAGTPISGQLIDLRKRAWEIPFGGFSPG